MDVRGDESMASRMDKKSLESLCGLREISFSLNEGVCMK